MSSVSCMSSQVIPGGSQNSCCHSHRYRARAILEGRESRMNPGQPRRRQTCRHKQRKDYGRITPSLRLHLAGKAQEVWDTPVPTEPSTSSQIFIQRPATAESRHSTEKGENGEKRLRIQENMSVILSKTYRDVLSLIYRFLSTELMVSCHENAASPAVLSHVHSLIFHSLMFCIYLFLFIHCNSTVCIRMHYN